MPRSTDCFPFEFVVCGKFFGTTVNAPRRTEFLYLPGQLSPHRNSRRRSPSYYENAGNQSGNRNSAPTFLPEVPAPDIFPALHKAVLHFIFFFLLIQPPPRNSNSIIPCTVFSYKQTCRTCHSSVPFVCMETKNCRKSFSFKISFDSFLSSDRTFLSCFFFLNHRQKYQRLVSFAGNRMPVSVLAEGRHFCLHRIRLVVVLVQTLS